MDAYIMTAAQELGPRQVQEDGYAIARFGTQGSCCGQLLLVLDGHNHRVARASFVQTALRVARRTFIVPHADAVRQALYELTRRLDRVFDDPYAGATMSAVVTLDEGRGVHAAVLGDSPIVVVTSDKATALSRHTVHNPLERTRVLDRGGYIMGDYVWHRSGWGKHRREHGLQMTRSLGDRCLGDVILREPDIYTFERAYPMGILLCTDGFLDLRADEPSQLDRLAAEVRAGHRARQLLQTRMTSSLLDDNATVLIASSF